MTAALAAARLGLSVVICEATDQVGGTTSTSAGTLWLPGNRHGQQAGHGDSTVAGSQYLDALIGPDDELGRRRAFLESAGPAIEFLEDQCGLAFVSSGQHPDYLDLPGAAVYGRAISSQEFDGRMLGTDFDRVRPPLKDFLVLGGMMANKADVLALLGRYRSWPAFRRTVQLVLRYLRDRISYARGTRLVMGNAMVGRMLLGLRNSGVEIRFGTRLLSIEKSGNRVSGIVVECNGSTTNITARLGVVLATGGIGHNENLRRDLPPGSVKSLAPSSVRGDALDAAKNVGAVLERQARDFLWQPVSRVPDGNGGWRLFPHLYLDRAKPGLIAVNSSGKRFVNEGASYHHFVEGMLGSGKDLNENLPAYLVCDHQFIQTYGVGVIPPGCRNLRPFKRSGYLLWANTIPELARKIGVSPSGLSATLRQYNADVAAGKDSAFGKGETTVSRFNGDAKKHPNPCLGPVQAPPFYAVQIFPADAASCTGLRTDKDARVLDDRDIPIDGLYACGNDMASVLKGSYPGPGATLGPAIVFAYRAALHAHRRAMASPQQDTQVHGEQESNAKT